MLVALVLIEPVSAMGIRGMMGMHHGQKMGNSMNMHVEVDKHFIEQMIPHHEDAIAMAEMALVRAEHPEIKNLAQDIIESQTAEIEQMRGWYKSWYGTDVPEATMMGMHQTDMTKLENAEEFDKVFIEEMVPHHRMAVMMVRMLDMRTDRPEMKQLADNIRTTQTQEINQMLSWYNEWYR